MPLPEYFGRWNTVYRRFLLWSRKGILKRLFKALIQDIDTEWEFIDGSYIKAQIPLLKKNKQLDLVVMVTRQKFTLKVCFR
ncbi:hypothetical protein [uncultured Shewanella sp.]|uniref:hypothetical protein n=1 Tax=uncultured Shewanella sp. TaxID=173975 RepID=UPI002622505A|nr:hypothetical protein [uncultured Shewanella sp.]